MMFKVIYDSQDLDFKKPFGAVKQKEKIEFNIKTNELCDVKLITNSILGFESFNLDYVCYENNYHKYSLEFDTSKYLGPIYYYFELNNNGKHYYYTNNDDATGALGKLDTVKPDFYNSIGKTLEKKPELFYQVYVHDIKYEVPEWFKTGVTYHIFVDRFNNEDSTLEEIDKDLVEVYGGNLKGIINKLDYLEDLGVDIIYLSPIFEAEGHHKYNTGDYEKIAADFGNIDIFVQLISELKKRDMYLILDGVFNHSGSDSKYFNKEGNYESLGAYQSKDSKYYSWYNFIEYPDNYECWKDIDTLPEYNQENEEVLDYFFYNEDSIVKRWLNMGIDGWRLDAADLLSDEYLTHIYKNVKEVRPDAIIIGELWNDASTFISEEEKKIRTYMCGNEIESVTDYPFHGLIINYSNGEFTPRTFLKKIYSLIENFPIDYYYALWNFTGTHDIPRILSILDGDIDVLKMFVVLLMTLPGVPMIYYGDEVGLRGEGDPDNRRPFPWNNMNMDIYNHFKELIAIRQNSDAFKKGSVHFIEDDDFLIYKRKYEGEEIYTVLNNSDDKVFDISLISDGVTLKDILTDEVYSPSNSEFELKKLSYKLLKKEIC